MRRIIYLMFFLMPFLFVAGCINGQAVLSLNKDHSGKISIEGLFDYPLYCVGTEEDCDSMEKFFIDQIKTMVSSGRFEAWSDVKWKFLDDGRCYFKGAAYFRDINEVDFFIGSAKTGIKLDFTRRWDGKSTVELKLQHKFQLDPQIKKLPSEIFKTFTINLVTAMPAEVERSENFQQLDNQTLMFVFSGGQWLSFLRNNTVKAILTSDGNDLFDYKSEISIAKKEYVETLKRIETAYQRAYVPKDANSVSAKKDLNARLRAGLAAQEQGDFEKAVKIYEYVIKNGQTDEKSSAGAAYQIGVCLITMRRSEEAIKQFESVIDEYPQSSAALKSVKMLRDIRSGEIYKKEKEEKPKVFVVDMIPKLYDENVDPNTASIKITFSEPMKRTGWFYSSFSPADFPAAAGKPAFDSAGTEWTLPVKLEAGKVYALAVNCGDTAKNIKKLQTGFQSVSSRMCEKFVLVFATFQTDPNAEPLAIDDEFIERCEKVM